MKLKASLISLAFLILCSTAFGASTSTCYDTDCGLMLHLDSDYTDSSTNTKTVTEHGDAAISATAKFGAGSMFIQGTGYITAPDSDDWNLGTGAFTIEFQWRRVSIAAGAMFFMLGDTTDGIYLYVEGANAYLKMNGVNIITDAVYPAADGNFHHIAVTRSGTDVKIFVDGTQSGSTGTSNANITGDTDGVAFGADTAGGNIMDDCYYDEIRIVKGTAVYTANFVAPSNAYSSCTAPATATTNYTSCGVGVSGAYSIY